MTIFTEAARDKLLAEPNIQARAIGFGVTRGIGGFDPLPSVATELNGIIRHGQSDSGILPGETLLDNDFTYKALSSGLKSGTEIMHMASHFQFNPVMPSQSFLLLGDGSSLPLSDLANPDLSFDGIQQLTLSACETASGLGRGDGREVEGFGALVQRQGALSVIATLWPIADESTSLLMPEFYRQRFVEKQNKAEALRKAQLAIMQYGTSLKPTPKAFGVRGSVYVSVKLDAPKWEGSGYSHPFYWAPFILLGNWR